MSQVFAYTFDACHWMVDAETEVIELTNVEDSESEQEDKKEEFKNRAHINGNADLSFLIISNQSMVNNFYNSHLPEIHTPPPEFSFG